MLSLARRPVVGLAARIAALTVLPVVLGFWFLHLDLRNIDIPFNYGGQDQIWQLTLTKGLLDNGWVLNNPYMGAPDVAHWYNNPAAQTSALHSVIMWCIGRVVPDAVATQQVYFLLNFSLIAVTAYVACRLLLVERFVAVCVGLLYCFLQARFYSIFYAFIENYFIIPLAVVPSIWVLTGKFATSTAHAGEAAAATGLKRVLTGRYFAVSLGLLMLAAVTDGYYAFFALLLLGFAVGIRLLSGDARAPSSLVAPVLLILTLVTGALAVQLPLIGYRRHHPVEFGWGGAPDATISHRPAEAEIYSTTLKVLIAPLGYNRIPALGRLGMRIVGTYNEARRYPQGQFASLSTLGSLLLVGLLTLTAVTLARGGTLPFAATAGLEKSRRLVGATAALSLFVLLGSIAGGVGTLVALFYPVIRAYERFPLFLSFLLYCGTGVILTGLIARARHRALWRLGVAAVTVCGVLDQVPAPFPIQQDAARYRAERVFVRRVEASLPDAASIYQYPYSQYMSLNKYYGWGAFGHMRLYLHSRHLRWSNGASKNSPIDLWHTRLSELPLGQIVTEAEAVGFRGFLVDRTVVPDNEYAALRDVLVARTGRKPVEDGVSRLAFWALPDPGYRVEYAPDYATADRVIVTNVAGLNSSEPVSRMIDKAALLSRLAHRAPAPQSFSIDTERALFVNAALLDGGIGLAPIQPASMLQGDVWCKDQEGKRLSASHDTLYLRVVNRSQFDWTMNNGQFPIRVGLKELLDDNGSRLRWDGGFRVPGTITVPKGSAADVPTSLIKVDLHGGVPSNLHEVTAVFGLVQDGVVWPGGGECRVTLAE